MKRTSVLLLSVAALLLVFSGCKKKDTEPTYYMRASVNGNDVYVTDCILFVSGSGTIIKGTQTTATSAYAYLALYIPKGNLYPDEIKFYKVPGTYGSVFYTSGTSSTGTTGIVQILETTGTAVSGTFSFTCADGTVVTNGVFNAKRM